MGGGPPTDVNRQYRSLTFDRLFTAWYFAVRFAMADSAYSRGGAFQLSKSLRLPRHSAIVRVTHWIQALSFFALVVSGIAILLAHTRFYWGETGGEGAPPLLALPLRLHRPDVS